MNSGEECRHEETRTPDLYRVKKEVSNLKALCLLCFSEFSFTSKSSKIGWFGRVGDEKIRNSSLGNPLHLVVGNHPFPMLFCNGVDVPR
jgi:hypothetical protein